MRLHKNDIDLLTEAYINIGRCEYLDNKRILLEQELNNLYIVNEGIVNNILNTAGTATQGVYDAVAGTIDSTTKVAQNIIELPDKLGSYFDVALPQYIDKLSSFLQTVLISGASGAVLTQVVGRLLLMFSKKLQKSGEDNEAIIMRMLPDEVRDSIEAIKNLKQSNPTEYKRQVFKINQNALKELRSALTSTSKQAGSAVTQKILTFFGEVLSSATGSILGGIVIAYLIQKLGFNPMPIFPSP